MLNAVAGHLKGTCQLYWRFRNIWCRLCAHCMGNSQCSTNRSSSRTPAILSRLTGMAEGMNEDEMIVQACVAMWVGVMKATIVHERAEQDALERCNFGKRMMIGNYSGTLLYAILYGEKVLDWRYRERLMIASVRQVQRYALHIRDDVLYCVWKNHHAWLVSLQFNPLNL